MRGLGFGSAPEAQALDDLLILGGLGGLQVVEEFATLVHELHEPATRSMVALVRAEVLTEAIDALGKKRDLDFGRTGIVGGALELRDYTGFLFSGERHQDAFLNSLISAVFAGANSTEKVPQSIGSRV
jgi:hypothetical protein